MNPIFLWWLTLGAVIGFAAEWLWDWIWFRGRRRAVSVDVDTQVSGLQGERDKLALDLKTCGDRRVALEGELATARGQLGDLERYRARVSELELLVARVDELGADNARLHAELEAARTASVTLGAVASQTLGASADGGEDGETAGDLREYNVAMYD